LQQVHVPLDGSLDPPTIEAIVKSATKDDYGLHSPAPRSRVTCFGSTETGDQQSEAF